MNTYSANYLSRSLKLWALCLVEVAYMLPLLVIAHNYLVPELITLSAIYILPAILLGGVLLRSMVSVMWKRIGISILPGMLLALAGVAGPLGQPALLLAAGTGCALLGITSAERKRRNKLYLWGMALYLLAGIVFPRLPQLASYLSVLTWTGALCLAWTLFATNREFLQYSTFSKEAAGQRLPRGLRRHNSLWIGVIMAAAFLLAAGAGRYIAEGLLAFIRMIFGWLGRPSAEETPIQEPVLPPMEMNLPEQGQPDRLAQWLNMIFYVFGIVALLALIGLCGYLLYKKARNSRGIWRRLVDRLLSLLRRNNRSEEEAAFVDEETRLSILETTLNKWKDRLNPFSRIGRRAERWEDLCDNRERVRYLYRNALRAEQAEGYEVKSYLTPRETEEDIRRLPVAGKPGRTASSRDQRRSMADTLLGVYYRVRYGEQEPQDEEVARIRREMNL